MNTMAVQGIFASSVVRDLDAALAWYEKLLGRPADDQPIPGMAQWRNMGAAGFQLWADETRAGKSITTIVVLDLAAEQARLATHEISLVNEAQGPFGAVAQVFDPEGNRINLAQPPQG